MHKSLKLPLRIIDLRGLEETVRRAQALDLMKAEARRVFDLARGPLLRTTLLRLGEEEHVFLLTMHHIVSDGWSMNVFSKEMAALYEAYASGMPSPLAEPLAQYVMLSRSERQWLQGDGLKGHLDYWKQKLDGAPPLLEVPTDRPRPEFRPRAARCK